MKVLLVVAIWVWWTIMVVPAWAIIFDVTDSATEESYSTSIRSLRDQLKSKEVKYGIPVMRQPSTLSSSNRFLLVELKASTDKSITLAIDVTNLYVVGYRDKYQDKYRAHFFPDAPSIAQSSVFKEATTRVTIGFKSTYIDLEKAAGSDREKIQLGIINLRSAILSIYGKQNIDRKMEAKFLIISIQMVPEAARFKYIENLVLENGIYGSFTPNYKVLSLENNWGSISKAIQQSKSGEISPALELKDPDNKPWKVNKVSDIASDMGLLKYEGTT